MLPELYGCTGVVILLWGLIAGMELVKLRVMRHAHRLYQEAYELQAKAPDDWTSQMLARMLADQITDQADEVVKALGRNP